MFEIKWLTGWRRYTGPGAAYGAPAEHEPRPHIVGTTPEARVFIRNDCERTRPRDRLLGPFYTGYSLLDDGTIAFRFVDDTNLESHGLPLVPWPRSVPD
jgi:hypothetical protein